MDKRILINRIQCNYCDEVLTSHYRHHFITCCCGRTSNDGGTDYQHISGDNYTNLVIYTDSPFEEIRKYLCRGGRGKDGTEPLTYVPLKALSDEWLENIIKYEADFRPKNVYLPYYRLEQVYRKQNNISIPELPKYKENV